MVRAVTLIPGAGEFVYDDAARSATSRNTGVSEQPHPATSSTVAPMPTRR